MNGCILSKISLTLGFPLPEKNFVSVARERVKRVLYSPTAFPYHLVFLNSVYLRQVCRFYHLSICCHVFGLHKKYYIILNSLTRMDKF